MIYRHRLTRVLTPPPKVDESHVSGVQKGTVVRGERDCPTGVLHLTDCHDSVVYLLAPLKYAYLSGCSDCIVVLGAVGRLTRLERCDKVQVRPGGAWVGGLAGRRWAGSHAWGWCDKVQVWPGVSLGHSYFFRGGGCGWGGLNAETGFSLF